MNVKAIDVTTKNLIFLFEQQWNRQMIIFRKSTKDPQSLLDPTGNSGLMTILWNHRKNILRNNCFAGSMAQQVRVDQPRWKWKDLSLNRRSAAIIINTMIQWKRELFFYFWRQSTSVSAATTPGLDSWRPRQLQGEPSGEGGRGAAVDCPQLWVFVYLYLCIYICVFVYVYLYMCIVFVYLYLCICICVFVYVYLYMCICICVFVFVYLYLCRGLSSTLGISTLSHNVEIILQGGTAKSGWNGRRRGDGGKVEAGSTPAAGEEKNIKLIIVCSLQNEVVGFVEHLLRTGDSKLRTVHDTNIYTQIHIHKYKYTNTTTQIQIQIHKYKYTNTKTSQGCSMYNSLKSHNSSLENCLWICILSGHAIRQINYYY